MSMAKLFVEVLGIFISISYASSVSVASSDAYGQVEDVDLRSMYVYWISCKEYVRANSSMPCRMFQRSLYSKRGEKFCDLELNGKYIKNLQALSKDLVALNWYANYKNNFQLATTVINITNCNKSEARINETLTIFDIGYADHFRLATTFTSSNGKYHTISFNPDACNATLCALTFDANGKDIKVSSFYKSAFKNSGPIFDIKYLDIGKESYLVDQIWKFSLLQPTGYKLLMKYDLHTTHGQSFTHGTLRFCQNSTTKHDKINCKTFNANGEIASIASNININLTYVFEDIEVENLSNGGFLLFTHTNKWKHNYVTKFGANGKFVGVLELTGMPPCRVLCKSKGDLKIINNKYCRSILRQSLLGGFNYKRICFSDDDFNN